MQIGNPSYKKCPYCGQKNAYYAGSYVVHYYGVTEWSDEETFSELPSLKKTKLQKCDSCTNFYWFSQKGGGMSGADYSLALKYFNELYSRKNLKNWFLYSRNNRRIFYIRINILQRYNDRIRIHPLSNNRFSNQELTENEKLIFNTNATQLIELVKKLKPDKKLLLAELYRNIGDFENAKTYLKVINNPTSHKLLKEIENNNCNVITINSQ